MDARRELLLRLRGVATSLNAMVRSLATSRTELRRFAETQGALRRVATLVARGVSPQAAFTTVASELGRLLNADYTAINRYEPDRTVSTITQWSDPHVPSVTAPLEGRWPIGNDTAAAEVWRTGKPARRTSENINGEIGAWLRSHQIGHVVACPIRVEDRLWGEMATLFLGSKPPREDTEERMFDFTELVGCTIAQAESRAELIASRARIVMTSDATRRRIERDLHDGAQQHLITLGLQLHAAEASVPPEQEQLRQQLSSTAQGLSDVHAELQEIARGLHPAILAKGGLDAALTALAHRCPVPVSLGIRTSQHLPDQAEVTLYYAVSEALTNVLKHAHASTVRIDLDTEDDQICLAIRDDGVGGADLSRGSGLIGLNDRVAALNGTTKVSSPTGEGTTLTITIPIEATLDLPQTRAGTATDPTDDPGPDPAVSGRESNLGVSSHRRADRRTGPEGLPSHRVDDSEERRL
jgi:signal transduction histidine kinase